jgi:SAM-dependent methyltransferase
MVRFLRQLRPAWRATAVQLDRERRHQLDQDAFAEAADAYLASTLVRRLQIGTGENPLPGWFNTDVEPASAGVYVMDAVRPFPLPDRAFDYVFSEHMIEHVTYKGGLSLLSEAHRVLKPGGRIRIATPDLMKLIGLFGQNGDPLKHRYIEWSLKENLGLYAPGRSELQNRRSEWDIDQEHFLTYYPDLHLDGVVFIVNNFFRSYGHRFLYDSKTLKAAMRSCGFTQIQQRSPGESTDPELRDVDSHGSRIGDHNNQFETLVVEATRE